MEGWAIGKTKVFLRYFNDEYLSRYVKISSNLINNIKDFPKLYLFKGYMKSKSKRLSKCNL